MKRVIHPAGDCGLVVECPDLAAVMALHQGLTSPPPGVVDVIPAARTILVTVDHPDSLAPACDWLNQAEPLPAGASTAADLVTIDAEYGGPDLAEAARLTGRTAADLVAQHTSILWRVAFAGFAPGFGYLISDGWTIRLPRRSSPRTTVPAGSVSLADEFTGIYPRSSPGGWQIIGRTDAVLWDIRREPPALLPPGAPVRFRELR